MRNLPRDRRVEGEHAKVRRNEEAERAAHVPEEGLHERQPVQQLAGGFAILRNEPVARAVERHHTADTAGLLADAGREGHHETAALQVDAALVEAPAEQDRSKAGERLLVGKDRVRDEERPVGRQMLHRRRDRAGCHHERPCVLQLLEHEGCASWTGAA